MNGPEPEQIPAFLRDPDLPRPPHIVRLRVKRLAPMGGNCFRFQAWTPYNRPCGLKLTDRF
jgi:hypothetical protein